MKPPPQLSDAQGRQLLCKLRWGNRVFFLSYLGLLVLFTGLNIWRDSGSWALWLVQTLPLAIFIPGLIKGYFRTYSWICFAILIYFTWSVTNAMSSHAHWSDPVIVALCVSLFISAMMTSRWLQYYGLYQYQKAEREAADTAAHPSAIDHSSVTE